MLVERRANVHASCHDDAHVLPTNQEPFDGSFPHNCLMGPVNEEMRSFFNVVLRGRSALCGRVMVAGDANLDPRDKIACNISQLLIFNAVMGTYHTVNTVEPLTNDHPHQRPSLSYDHISCDGQWFLFVYESLTSDHPSYTTTPM